MATWQSSSFWSVRPRSVYKAASVPKETKKTMSLCKWQHQRMTAPFNLLCRNSSSAPRSTSSSSRSSAVNEAVSCEAVTQIVRQWAYHAFSDQACVSWGGTCLDRHLYRGQTLLRHAGNENVHVLQPNMLTLVAMGSCSDVRDMTHARRAGWNTHKDIVYCPCSNRHCQAW